MNRVKDRPTLRDTEDVIAILREVRVSATMQGTSFMNSGEDKDPTSLIKRVTKLWRGTWLIDPIDKAIRRLENPTKRFKRD